MVDIVPWCTGRHGKNISTPFGTFHVMIISWYLRKIKISIRFYIQSEYLTLCLSTRDTITSPSSSVPVSTYIITEEEEYWKLREYIIIEFEISTNQSVVIVLVKEESKMVNMMAKNLNDAIKKFTSANPIKTLCLIGTTTQHF